MTLQDLPAITVEEITLEGDELRLRGRFNHFTGVQLGTSYLYCGDAQWPGELINLNVETREAVFVAPSWVLRDRIGIGSVVPCLPCGWQYFHVNMILASNWERRTFVPSDAQHFRVGSAHGWTKVGEQLEPNHELTEIEPCGWDHEECAICYTHVGRGGQPEGYVNESDKWLCQTCYERYGRTRDLAFIFAT